MPNRIIKESICESLGLSQVSFFAEDLYKRLITYADDYGRFNADFQIILARLYPREIGIVNVDDIEDAMTELAGIGKVAFYTAEGRKEVYGCFPNWGDHQRLRNSVKKIPAPADTTVNDWYLRRFIPMSLKERIIERDKFKCQECGKFVSAECDSAKRLIKMGTGMFHIDHIVPVNQGGRATEENLRLLCQTCNLKRKRHFTFDEIVEFTNAHPCDSPQLAATCRNSPLESNPIQSNPIQNESESNSEKPKRKQKPFVAPTVEQVSAYCAEKSLRLDPVRFVQYYEAADWTDSKGKPVKNWKQKALMWEGGDSRGKPVSGNAQKSAKQFNIHYDNE